MEFKKVFISELKPAKYNPRKDLQPSDPEYQRIKRSIEEFGYVDPVIINSDNTVIGGHQRVKVLKELGHTSIDVVIVDLPKTKEKALNIALNKITGEWDQDKLAAVLNELKAEDFDIEIAGFDDAEFKDLLKEIDHGEAKEDDYVPPPEIVTDIKRGDIYQLGRHRVMCGDSTSKEDVGRLMEGKKADMCITSPPYFNQREYSQWKEYSDYLEFVDQIVSRASEILSDNCIFGVNIGSDEPARRWMPSDWWDILKKYAWIYRESFAWVKAAAVWSVPRSMHIEKGKYFPALRWEIILTCSRGKHPDFDIEDRDKVREFDENVWQIAVVTGSEQKKIGHPAPFPLEIPRRFCLAYTKKGQIAYEPFLGSGTTLIACEQLGRICYGMEISPQYCEVICQRWEKLTGRKREKVSG